MNEVCTSKIKDEMRAEHRREDLGKGVRGKYFARVSKGTNLVLLDDKVTKSFPNDDPVNQALLRLLALTEQTARITSTLKAAFWMTASERQQRPLWAFQRRSGAQSNLRLRVGFRLGLGLAALFIGMRSQHCNPWFSTLASCAKQTALAPPP